MQFLAKSLSKSIRPSTARQSWILSHSNFSSSSRALGSKSESVTPVESSEWPRPMEIPYQREIENSVSFIGYVNKPVEFSAQPDGKSSAGTFISHASADSPRNFGVPIIFEGDLAHTAKCHLEKGDRVHINGQILGDFNPSRVENGQANVHVLVSDFSYILGSKAPRQVLPESDFEAPHQVLPASDLEAPHQVSPASEATVQKTSDSETDPWSSLVNNPSDWRDYREKKQNGSVNPRFPDFKKKDGSVSLWLNKAPNHILSNLKDLKFDIPVTPTYPKQEKAGEESWEDVVQNKENWWDNRLDKKNPKAPDFVHKKTRVALWLNTCPSSLLTDLPPPKSK